jgi:hypothetical protein
MIFRNVAPNITFDTHLKHYFYFWCGDEILLEASTDAEAIAAGEKLRSELESSE